MSPLHVFILSIIEGITEFLPISSTGHLILASRVLNLEASDFQKTFEIVIQLGAILAVVTLYSKKLLTDSGLIKKLLIGFIPTAVVGFTLYPLIKEVLLESPAITLNALFWGGVALIIIERLIKNSGSEKQGFKVREAADISYGQALVVGTFQSLSVVPGVSRAAATIIGGLSAGLSRKAATEFSFLLAIPTMVAASALDLWKSRDVITRGGSLTLFAGTVLSFFFAILAVKFLINYVKKHDFTVFGVYRIVLAIVFWLLIK